MKPMLFLTNYIYSNFWLGLSLVVYSNITFPSFSLKLLTNKKSNLFFFRVFPWLNYNIQFFAFSQILKLKSEYG